MAIWITVVQNHGSVNRVDDVISETANGGRVAPALLIVPAKVCLSSSSEHASVFGWEAIQHPVRRLILGKDLAGGDGRPNPGQSEDDIASVSVKVADQLGQALHGTANKV